MTSVGSNNSPVTLAQNPSLLGSKSPTGTNVGSISAASTSNLLTSTNKPNKQTSPSLLTSAPTSIIQTPSNTNASPSSILGQPVNIPKTKGRAKKVVPLTGTPTPVTGQSSLLGKTNGTPTVSTPPTTGKSSRRSKRNMVIKVVPLSNGNGTIPNSLNTVGSRTPGNSLGSNSTGFVMPSIKPGLNSDSKGLLTPMSPALTKPVPLVNNPNQSTQSTQSTLLTTPVNMTKVSTIPASSVNPAISPLPLTIKPTGSIIPNTSSSLINLTQTSDPKKSEDCGCDLSNPDRSGSTDQINKLTLMTK